MEIAVYLLYIFCLIQVKKLKSEAAKKGVTLRLMPVGFKKRTENTSFFHYKYVVCHSSFVSIISTIFAAVDFMAATIEKLHFLIRVFL